MCNTYGWPIVTQLGSLWYSAHLLQLRPNSCTVHVFIVTCVGRSKALAVPLLPLLYEVRGMANIKRSITKLLNDDVILTLAHPVMASYM